MLNEGEQLLRHIAVHEAGHLLACAVFNKNLASDQSFIIQIDQNGLNINDVQASGHVSLDLSQYEKQEQFKEWLMINYLMGYRTDLLINGTANEALFENDKKCWNKCATENEMNSLEQIQALFKQHTKIADDFINANQNFIKNVANLLIKKQTLVYKDVESLLSQIKFTCEFPLSTLS